MARCLLVIVCVGGVRGGQFSATQEERGQVFFDGYARIPKGLEALDFIHEKVR